MNDLSHPSSVLDAKTLELIRKDAPQAEKNGRFTKGQMAVMHEQRWLKMLSPARYGGAEHSLPEALQLEEALAWADGSIGWMVTLCAGAGWFGGFTDPELSKKIFTDPKMCIAGSGSKTGTAEQVKNGYIINGEWPHASGAPEATVFSANCIVTQNGKPVKDGNKNKVLSFLFMKDEVTLIPTWNTIGMIATASNGYKVTNLTVAENRVFNSG